MLAEEGESAHRARGAPPLVLLYPNRTQSRVGDPAATLSDDPKRSVNGAGLPEVVFSLADELELTDPVYLSVGETKGQDDCRCLRQCVAFIRFSNEHRWRR